MGDNRWEISFHAGIVINVTIFLHDTFSLGTYLGCLGGGGGGVIHHLSQAMTRDHCISLLFYCKLIKFSADTIYGYNVVVITIHCIVHSKW